MDEYLAPPVQPSAETALTGSEGAQQADAGETQADADLLGGQANKIGYFFRWLRGEYDHLGTWDFPSDDQPTETENTTEAEAGPSVQSFLTFKKRAEDIAKQLKQQANIEFTLEVPSKTPGYLCDGCDKRIELSDYGFFCTLCSNGDFDLCRTCVTQGRGCEGGHMLHMTTGYDWKAHRNVRRFPSKKVLRELRSAPGPQWDDGPLFSALDTYLETVDSSAHPRSKEFSFPSSSTLPPRYKHHVNSMLRKWAQICILLAEDTLYPSFRSTLTPLQLVSVRLLLEWWMGDIQDYRLTFMGIHSRLVQALLPMSEEERSHGVSGMRRFMSGLEKSAYHKHLFSLMYSEFFPENPPAKAPDQKPILHCRRENAAIFAAAQRSACRLLVPSAVPPWLQGEHVYDSADIGCIISSGEIHYRKMLTTAGMQLALVSNSWRVAKAYPDAFNQACKASVLLAVENFVRGEQILGKNMLSASLVSCPWLSHHETTSNHPYFLWDVEKRRTIQVAQLGFEPVYTAISHTWGRWRIDDAGADVPGVPWRVPRNTRFPVEQIPNILRKVPGGNRSAYIWFDLVCIPQDTATAQESATLRQQEIARQAGIFNNAEHVIAWFSDITSFASFNGMLGNLALNALKFPPVIPRPGVDSVNLIRASKEYCEDPFLKADGRAIDDFDVSNWHDHINEWFTSLWTLQEACIRPDMWMCSKDWMPLIIPTNVENTDLEPLSLDALMALLRFSDSIGTTEFPRHHRVVLADSQVVQANCLFRYGSLSACENIVREMPENISTLLRIMRLCGLYDMSSITPVEILSFGNMRFCSERRAEAIMSILGATRWLNASANLTSTPAELVIGRYQLSFVQEVREKVGHGAFFGGWNIKEVWMSTQTEIEASLSNIESASESHVGSLLPFGASVGSDRRIWTGLFSSEAIYPEDHISLVTWRIHQTGSVFVPCACILASSRDLGGPTRDPARLSGVKAEITDFHQCSERTMKEVQSLDEWITSRSYNAYAVSLTCFEITLPGKNSRGWLSTGVILREVRPGLVAKSGRFNTQILKNHDLVFPESTETNLYVV